MVNKNRMDELSANILIINHAAELGREGFYIGLNAPAQDTKCLKLIEGRPIGDMVGLAILDSWLSAWHYEQMRSTLNDAK